MRLSSKHAWVHPDLNTKCVSSQHAFVGSYLNTGCGLPEHASGSLTSQHALGSLTCLGCAADKLSMLSGEQWVGGPTALGAVKMLS